MKRHFYTVSVALLLLGGACNSGDDDNLIFEQTADERVAEAINNLRQLLTAPANGWVIRYQPVPESGAYNVLLDFDEDGNVRIRTDFGVNNNEFYDQTITYRIDNSLGLELIFENYSFFSYLFEQNGATFEAEYELDYVNETPDGALVFSSKTDLTSLTTLVLAPAPENGENLLGREINANLETLSSSLGVVSPIYRLDYVNRDLSIYLSLNTDLRTINFTYATSSNDRGRPVEVTTGYLVQGNSIVLSEPLTGNFLGVNVNIPEIALTSLAGGSSVDACGEPLAIQQYRGTIAESGDPIALSPTLFDPAGEAFQNRSRIYLASSREIFNNGTPIGGQIEQDIEGFELMVLYYQFNNQGSFISLGFGITQPNGDFIVPVKEFDPVYTDNQVDFNFDPEYIVAIGDTTAVLDTLAMDIYINNLTEGGDTRVLQSGPGTYEFYNPCTGWSAILTELN